MARGPPRRGGGGEGRETLRSKDRSAEIASLSRGGWRAVLIIVRFLPNLPWSPLQPAWNDFNWFQWFICSLFQAVSTRTAGYNAVDLSTLQRGYLVWVGLMMIIVCASARPAVPTSHSHHSLRQPPPPLPV